VEPYELDVIVEIPRGSRNKYEYDPELGAIRLDRLLFSSVAYPTDYGYIPNTLAVDGEPLDALVCVSEPTFSGCVIPAKVVALFRMHEDQILDDKVLCVPCHDPNWNHIDRLEQLQPPLREEIAHFFAIYREPEGRHVDVDGWQPREAAIAVIEESRARYAEAAKRVAAAEAAAKRSASAG